MSEKPIKKIVLTQTISDLYGVKFWVNSFSFKITKFTEISQNLKILPGFNKKCLKTIKKNKKGLTQTIS